MVIRTEIGQLLCSDTHPDVSSANGEVRRASPRRPTAPPRRAIGNRVPEDSRLHRDSLKGLPG